MITQIKIAIPACTFIRDPQETKLGGIILAASVELLDEIGFEAFTFKKLAQRIESTEASVYRYFENKHQLLLFLYSWYWGWMHYRIESRTRHLGNTKERLRLALELLLNDTDSESQLSFLSEPKLKLLIEHEGIKSFLVKNIDNVNRDGAFENYKQLVELLSGWVHEIRPEFSFPNMLITTLIEGAHLQHFFAEHLPRLTNVSSENDNVTSFFLLLTDTFIFNDTTHG
jgi:AcrR family transcriptional regulator